MPEYSSFNDSFPRFRRFFDFVPFYAECTFKFQALLKPELSKTFNLDFFNLSVDICDFLFFFFFYFRDAAGKLKFGNVDI